MLINILGCDGSGKSTQIRKLLEWANHEHNVKARELAKKNIFDTELYPECDFFGVTYEVLAHKLLPKMRGESRAIWLFYMNMVLIRGTPPRKDELVFLDGYWHKHYATEAALGLPKDWLLEVCSTLPEPDLTILLDVDHTLIVQRGHDHKPYESGCDFQCSDESFVRQQSKVREILRELADMRNYVVVDAAEDENAVFSSIINEIQRHPEFEVASRPHQLSGM